MSYVAIARRHRPNTFEEMAGQSHVTRTLKNAIERDRIHHAYLFSGPRGVGKTTSARALARALNCIEGPTVNPCGTCTNCTDILKGASADVIEIDGASNNSVDNIRELRESVQYLPSQGLKKIYIIDEVHMLSKGAFNALLKTLEEPPDHVMFIFATTEPNKLPDTILSRVQRFEFKRIPIDTVVKHLAQIAKKDGIDIDMGGLRLIARAGGGSMRDSQSLLDQVISFGGDQISTSQVSDALGLVDRGFLYQMLQGLVTNNPVDCLDSIHKVYAAGYDLTEFSSEMLEVLRNATLIVLSPDSHRFVDIPEDEIQQLQRLAKLSTPDVFTRAFQVMLEVHEQVSRSPRPKLALEMAVARLVSLRPARSIDDLLTKISQIQAGIQVDSGRNPVPQKKNDAVISSTVKQAPQEKQPKTPPQVSRENNPKQSPPLSSQANTPKKKASGFLPPSGTKRKQSANKAEPRWQKPPSEPPKQKLDSAENSPKATPEAPPLDKDEQRFDRFFTYIMKFGGTKHLVLENVAIHSIANQKINFVCVGDFALSQVKKLSQDPIVSKALLEFYQCKSFQVRLRDPREKLETQKEKRLRLQARQKESIRQQLNLEPHFRKIQEHFGLKNIMIRLDEER